jgi:Zn-dependent M28 family amino/carboxypeptidase
MLGAHLDSVLESPGANDNATGVAAALEIAAVVARMEDRSRGFRVAPWGGEEDGLQGPRATWAGCRRVSARRSSRM